MDHTNTTTNIRLNKQQFLLTAYIDLTLGISSLIPLVVLYVTFKHSDQNPFSSSSFKIFFASFCIFAIMEVGMAVFMLTNVRTENLTPLKGRILIVMKSVLFLASLFIVVILFFLNLIAAVIGVLILKYKLFGLWVLWSLCKDCFFISTSAGDEDTICIIGNSDNRNDNII